MDIKLKLVTITKYSFFFYFSDGLKFATDWILSSLQAAVKHQLSDALPSRNMRDITLSDNDVDMYDYDITQEQFTFFYNHKDTFKRMMKDQVNMFESPLFSGVMHLYVCLFTSFFRQNLWARPLFAWFITYFPIYEYTTF